MYSCLNFVTNPEGEPDAVLLRGLEAVYGTGIMTQNRFRKSPDQLTAYQRRNCLNGPGKCCHALGLDKSLDGLDLLSDQLFLCDSPADAGFPAPQEQPFTVDAGPRVGIDYAEEAVDFPWRFTIKYKIK